MGPELIAYPFLFVALFFEVFILVTFLSKPARLARERVSSGWEPAVAIIIPCYNEESTVAGTAASALALDYPKDKLEVILVDDGSTDGTRAAMEQFRGNPQVRILHKENGGKHTALNCGIASTNAEIVGCLDADSFVEPGALRALLPSFTSEKVGATTAAMSIHEPKTLIQHMQNAEYIFGIALRHALCSINGIYVTPGPFSFYRKRVIDELGGFRFGHQTEDMEMALRIQRAGYAIENAPMARVYTKAPATTRKLVKQRTRWTSGFMRNMMYDYRDLVGNRKYGALGLMVLPLGIFAIVGGLALFFVVVSMAVNSVIQSYLVHRGVPYTFELAWPAFSFDWFYVPVSLYLVVTLVTLVIMLSTIWIGKRISGTRGSLVRGLVGYLAFYGLIAPFWLIRATADVFTGTKRSWR